MTDLGPEITVNARDLGGNLKKSWKCRKLNSEGSTLVLLGQFSDDIRHGELGLIHAGTLSYEYFFPNCWYNIFRFEHPFGGLRNWYCNITKPPLISKDSVEYVDLEIDVLIWPDRSFKILDVDEYEQSASEHQLSEADREQASFALTEVLALFRDGRFPFDI